jgi:hypothetical protein
MVDGLIVPISAITGKIPRVEFGLEKNIVFVKIYFKMKEMGKVDLYSVISQMKMMNNYKNKKITDASVNKTGLNLPGKLNKTTYLNE